MKNDTNSFFNTIKKCVTVLLMRIFKERRSTHNTFFLTKYVWLFFEFQKNINYSIFTNVQVEIKYFSFIKISFGNSFN